MEQKYLNYLFDSFKKLIEIYGFKITNEYNDERDYRIEYSSTNFVIVIQYYLREFYVSLYKLNDPNNGINLFNLLDYLKQDDPNVPKSEYFRKEKNLEECFRKQFEHISSVIYNNYDIINDFFTGDSYESSRVEIRKYLLNKYPDLFKRG